MAGGLKRQEDILPFFSILTNKLSHYGWVDFSAHAPLQFV
jgi:hypothetical protein